MTMREEKLCAICLEVLRSEESAKKNILFKCSHNYDFHENCVWNYIRQKLSDTNIVYTDEVFVLDHLRVTCPICRSENYLFIKSNIV